MQERKQMITRACTVKVRSCNATGAPSAFENGAWQHALRVDGTDA